MAKLKSAKNKAGRIGGKKVNELKESRKTSSFLQKGIQKKPKKFYKDVGLVADPNKAIGKKSSKKEIKSNFVEELKRRANRPQKKKFKFSKVMSEELDYYIETYGDDYESMARDSRNVYQDSQGQIRYKILKYNKQQQR